MQIDGNTAFVTNSAAGDGGETGVKKCGETRLLDSTKAHAVVGVTFLGSIVPGRLSSPFDQLPVSMIFSPHLWHTTKAYKSSTDCASTLYRSHSSRDVSSCSCEELRKYGTTPAVELLPNVSLFRAFAVARSTTNVKLRINPFH